MRKSCAGKLALIVILPLMAFAQRVQPKLPNTPAGRHMDEFIRKFNAQGYKDPRWQRWFAVYGPVDLYSIEKSADYDLWVWTRGRITKGWMGLHLVLKPEPPHEVDGLGIISGLRPKASARPAHALSPSALANNVRAYLEELSKGDYFSGAVLVAKDGLPIFKQAYGFASKRYNVTNRTDTKFNLASVTKMFTAVAIAQLAEQGKLSLNDPISKYLPYYPGEIAKKATIHQLLTHTSGLGKSRYDKESIFERLVRPISEYLTWTVAPPAFEPGTDVRYSNEGYLVLGAVIERVSGQSYYDYVQKNIYDRAGMINSGAFEGDREIPNLATRYTNWRWRGERDFEFEAGPRRNTDYMSAIKGDSAGRTYSTVEDLQRFAVAFMAHRLVGPEMTRLMMTRQVELAAPSWSGVKEGYGYGFEIRTVGETTAIGKDGGTDGVRATFLMFPRQGYTVIVLSNYDTTGIIAGEHIRDLIIEGNPR